VCERNIERRKAFGEGTIEKRERKPSVGLRERESWKGENV
jgi:hypothetical protein